MLEMINGLFLRNHLSLENISHSRMYFSLMLSYYITRNTEYIFFRETVLLQMIKERILELLTITVPNPNWWKALNLLIVLFLLIMQV